MEHVKEVLGWKKKKQVWGKLLYVFGYDINWLKADGKFLITYVSTKSKEKEKRYKSKLHSEKKKKIKRMQTKEVHNEVSNSQD